MKLYFCGSIKGGRDDQALYADIIRELKRHGKVLTEHVGSENLTADGERGISCKEIFSRDMSWIDEADAVVAEVTTPSLGVGFELGAADARSLPVLCLFRPDGGGAKAVHDD